MPCSITGDLSIGHAGFSPSPITPTTATVLVMGVPPHVVGDVIGPHVLGTSAHGGTIGKASTTVLAGGKGIARMMDKGDCGALILGTGATVMVGG
tara:strand:- start:140 stop:424 length:285 start_codon:yes stop_codon:yes gene_type:complete